MLPRAFFGSLLLLGVAGACLPVRAQETSPADGAKFFETHVQPILETNCVSCHGGDKTSGELKLTSRQGILTGGNRGPAVSPGKPDESLLLQAISHTDPDLKMPPKKEKLPQEQIDLLTQWVKIGAPWPQGVTLVQRGGPPKVDDAARSFWSFRTVVRPNMPEIKNAGWVKSPIDAFILAKLEAAGLKPATPVSKTSLLRRVYYNLTGLPPSMEEVDAFLRDSSPDAYEKVVDRLLASPQYGERWGRHWLDLVRYGETNGYEVDGPKANVWRYRDYIIKSFNDDKPYDRFVKEQLAGDEIDPSNIESFIATGYFGLAPSGAQPDRLQAMFDSLDDIVATTSQVFLGLSANCARCHDHKLDPFPQADYYRLLAFFRNVGRTSQRRLGSDADMDLQKEAIFRFEQQIAALRKNIKEFEDDLRPHLVGGEIDDFKNPDYRVDIARKHMPQHVAQQDFEYYRDRVRQLAQLERTGKPTALAQAMGVAENSRTAPQTFVLLRGNPRSEGDKVEPGFPSVLTTKEPEFKPLPSNATSSGRRTVLADWIASPENPLTARVMVNRIWQHHFGRGIVRSSNDFGFKGAPPTHPELLDWLASEFVAGGWKLKSLHKLIVMSNAFQMSSLPNEATVAKDPENNLFGYFDLRRLEAEEVRDSILAVAGNINLGKMGGPPIYPKISKEVFAGQSRPGSGWGTNTPDEESRRSVYVHVKRSLLLPLLVSFDLADPDSSCPVRFTTTVPTQALCLINGEFVNEQAAIFAASVRAKAGDDQAAQVRLALRRATQREPSAKEVERGVEFMNRLKEQHQSKPNDVLKAFCLLALNLSEFIYLD